MKRVAAEMEVGIEALYRLAGGNPKVVNVFESPAELCAEKPTLYALSSESHSTITSGFYYAIPLGRNLRGIVIGYGAFLAMALVNLTLIRRFGNRAQALAS